MADRQFASKTGLLAPDRDYKETPLNQIACLSFFRRRDAGMVSRAFALGEKDE